MSTVCVCVCGKKLNIIKNKLGESREHERTILRFNKNTV